MPPNEGLRRVQEWQPDLTVPESSSASRLTRQCIIAFRKLLQILSAKRTVSPQTYRRYETSFTSLVIWENDSGIAKGKLEDALARSQTLFRSIVEPLASIGKTLANKLIPLLDSVDDISEDRLSLLAIIADVKVELHEQSHDGSESDESDSDASSCDTDNIDEIAEDLLADTECLIDLESMIECPILSTRNLPKASYLGIVPVPPHTAYEDKIRNRFPEAEVALIDRLARANWARFLATKDARERNQALRDMEDEGEMQAEFQVPPTVAAPSEMVSKFHDSGLGTSIDNQSVRIRDMIPDTSSSYAETVMSYRQQGSDSIRIPALPKEAKEGKAFECLACGDDVLVRTNAAWKRHLFSDLQPWICYDVKCQQGDATFPSKRDWVLHLTLEHRIDSRQEGFQCPLCQMDIGVGDAVISKHLSSHMEEISLAALPLGIDPDDASESEKSEESEEEFQDEPESTAQEPPPPKADNAEINTDKNETTLELHEGMRLKREAFAKLAAEEAEESARKMREAAQLWLGSGTPAPNMDNGRKSARKPKESTDTARLVDSNLAGAENPKIDQDPLIAPRGGRQPARPDGRNIYISRDGLERAHSPNSLLSLESDLDMRSEAPESLLGLDDAKFYDRLEDRKRSGLTSQQAAADMSTKAPVPKESSSTAQAPGDGEKDPSEPKNCYCNDVSNGQMIECSAEKCPRKWFHLSCVGIKTLPQESIWYCKECKGPENRAGQETSSAEPAQKHPATFQCTLCPKRFSRAYNLRSHLRSHTDERPFVCTICGKAFARQHDRQRHESLHSGEKKFVCKGDLKDGRQWGCGRRFARADALGRHFRSEAGRICIRLLLDEEILERQRLWLEQCQQQNMMASQPVIDPTTGFPSDASGKYSLPAALIQQYPALALEESSGTDMGGGLDDNLRNGPSLFATNDFDDGSDGGYVTGPHEIDSTGSMPVASKSGPEKPTIASTDPEADTRFACPFYKHGFSHGAIKRACNGLGWKEIRRVREHIVRSHCANAQCNVCMESFRSQSELIQHQRDQTCPLRDRIAGIHGIDDAQKEALSRRTRKSDHDRWIDWYQVIFPGVPEAEIPSPYVDDVKRPSDRSGTVLNRPEATSSGQRAPVQLSSYWSVSELKDLPRLLHEFGSDWSAISAYMKSKTATMVKDHYDRQKSLGHPEWEQIVQEADAKRARAVAEATQKRVPQKAGENSSRPPGNAADLTQVPHQSQAPAQTTHAKVISDSEMHQAREAGEAMAREVLGPQLITSPTVQFLLSQAHLMPSRRNWSVIKGIFERYPQSRDDPTLLGTLLEGY